MKTMSQGVAIDGNLQLIFNITSIKSCSETANKCRCGTKFHTTLGSQIGAVLSPLAKTLSKIYSSFLLVLLACFCQFWTAFPSLIFSNVYPLSLTLGLSSQVYKSSICKFNRQWPIAQKRTVTI